MKTFSINTVISAILMAGILSCASETSVETSSGALKTFSSFNVDIEECPITKVHLENGGKIKWDLYDGPSPPAASPTTPTAAQSLPPRKRQRRRRKRLRSLQGG